MQKDVIYIDVEDDITAIISKVNAAKKTVVALVPPKRIGVLQSAVNLQLLARAAKQNDKMLALVTTNQALMALASAASIPVARNLQSKPELIEVDDFEDEDDDEDIINGAELPVGEHARQTTGDEHNKKLKSAAVQEVFDEADADDASDEPEQAPARKKSSVKIPNFNKFRKRLILGICAGIFLVVFLVWAIVFAPRATVLISAKTTSSSINSPVTIKTSVKTDYKKATLKAVEKTDSEEKSITFSPTGEKDVGKKAAATVKFSRQSLSDTIVPAGTELETSGGLVFITDTSVTVPASTTGPGCFPLACPGEVSVSVTAEENGSKYNAASGSLSGAPSSISASFTSPSSGGVSKIVDVVTAGDVQKAKQQLVDEDTDVIRDDLLAKFDSGTKAVSESFTIGYKNVTTTPAVGDEASSSATLTATVVYTVYGVEKAELDTFLDAYLKEELKTASDQRVYKNGADEVVFQEANKSKGGATATLVATAQVGPKIEDTKVKEEARGKRYGEIQEAFTSVQGVEKVDVKFFPFWVSTVPNDDKKITVEFTVDESN